MTNDRSLLPSTLRNTFGSRRKALLPRERLVALVEALSVLDRNPELVGVVVTGDDSSLAITSSVADPFVVQEAEVFNRAGEKWISLLIFKRSPPLLPPPPSVLVETALRQRRRGKSVNTRIRGLRRAGRILLRRARIGDEKMAFSFGSSMLAHFVERADDRPSEDVPSDETGDTD